ncbi:MAG TPA: phytanoyl-CoA dioxygenase family protein [Bryobacteraceae bacterium]
MHDPILRDLQDYGVALWKAAVRPGALGRVRTSAEEAFTRVSSTDPAPQGFTPFSWSLRVEAIPAHEELLAQLSCLQPVFDQAMAAPVRCNLNESWVRKRFAPAHAPRHYQPNRWHQDGGLGVAYSSDPATPLAMTRLLTCWVPLDDCGRDRPGLELVRHRLDALQHYSQLDDRLLRQRFAADRFWIPELRAGDALVFLDGCLHRTHADPGMEHDRFSIEYRFFPMSSPPVTMES